MWENKFKTLTSAGKAMASVFCENDGFMLVWEAAQAKQSDVWTLNKSEQRIRRILWIKESESRSCTPYDTELTTTEFHVFVHLKDACRGRRFADNDELHIS